MFRNLTVKSRMLVVIALICCLFALMCWLAVSNSTKIKNQGLEKTSAVMLEDQKAKIQVATHSIALALEQAIQGQNEEQKISTIRKLIDTIRFETDKSGYYFVYRDTTCLALPPAKEKQGKDLGGAKDSTGIFFVRELRDQAHKGGGFVRYIYPKPPTKEEKPKLGYAEMIPGTEMWVGTGVYIDNIDQYLATMESEINSQTSRALIVLGSSAGTIFVVLISIILYISFSIVRRLKGVALSIHDIAKGEGDLTKRLPVTASDEIDELSRGFNDFIGKLHAIIHGVAVNSEKVASASLTLVEIAGELTQQSKTGSQHSTMVAKASDEMNANLTSVAVAMEESSESTTIVASAAEEMNVTIGEIAQNAEQAHQISEEAVEKAERTSVKIKELGQAALAINKVTEAITEISEQTNLLALNATIEAARAGEAGKGFAVVANEIKELAKQTATATLDIKQQIGGIQSTTEGTVKEISEIMTVISRVNGIVGNIATAVNEQSAAMREVALSIEQVSKGLQDVNQNVSQNSQVANSITRDMEEVNHLTLTIADSSDLINKNADQLRMMSSELNQLVGVFKL